MQHLSYHWLFWFPLVAVIVSTAGIIFFVPESPLRAPGRIDWVGALLLSGWLVSLLVGVSEGPACGWSSPRVLGLFAAGVTLLRVWVRAEFRIVEPWSTWR